MNSANITNTTCNEIIKIKAIYWEWHDQLLNIQKVKRDGSWRISSFELKPGASFKSFNVDVTDWQIGESVTITENGPTSSNELSGFLPKINESVESYFNTMVRRPMVVVYETFNGEFFLYGGLSSKCQFTFKKGINNRNGYDVLFSTVNNESSLIINDTDIFPAPPNITNKILLQINGDDFAELPCGSNYDLVVKDDLGAVVGSKVGSEYIVPSGIVPSGVLFRFPTGQQHTSYRTGDEGYRKQNGWYDIAIPANPKVIASLDYSQGADAWYCLKDNLVVNGVSSKTRFVGIDGTQTFPSSNNKDYLLIDKLTGLGLVRNYTVLGSNVIWDDAIDNALSYSVVVDGVTYSDFYLPSLEELLLFYGQFGNNNGTISSVWQDTKTGNYLILGANTADIWTSTTVPINTAWAYELNPNPLMNVRPYVKATTGLIKSTYIFDARTLISAP